MRGASARPAPRAPPSSQERREPVCTFSRSSFRLAGRPCPDPPSSPLRALPACLPANAARAIANLYEFVRQRTHGPELKDPAQQLDKIQVYLQDLRDITSEYEAKV